GLQALATRDAHDAIDLWRIRFAASDCNTVVNGVDEHTHASAHLGFQAFRADFRGALHETDPALFLHFLGDMSRERIGAGALDGRVLEAADTVELRLVHPVEQLLELRFGLAGEPDDESTADHQVGTGPAPGF